MTKLLLPLSDVKRYAKALKKSPKNTLNYTQLTDVVVKALGHEDLREFKFHSKYGRNFEAAYQAVDRLSLYDLKKWSQAFANELSRNGVDTDYCGYGIFDKYIDLQLESLVELPALRISGLLFLLSYLSDSSFFDPKAMTFDGSKLLDYLRNKALLQSVKFRLAEYSEKNRLTGSRYHEGVFSDLMGSWGRKDLTDDGFVQEVQKLLDAEAEYLDRFHMGRPDIYRETELQFPAAPRRQDTPSNTEFLQRVRNTVNLNSPLLLGSESRGVSNTPFAGESQSSKNLLLTNAEIKENIMITGVAGSGRVRVGLGMVHQAIIAGSGCVFIDGAGSLVSYALISSMAKSVGRQDDVVFYSINHDSLFEANEIQRLISANKIVVLCLTALEKDPEAFQPALKRLMKTLRVAVSWIDRKKMSRYFPYLIVFCDALRIWRIDDEGIFPEMITKANKANIGVLAIDQEIDIFEKVIKDGIFRHQILMKQCDISDSPNFREFYVNKSSIRRDILNLDMGEFVYRRLGQSQEREHKIYRSPYSDPNLEDIYLVMS